MMDILAFVKNYVFIPCMAHYCCAVSKPVFIKVLDKPKRIHFYQGFLMFIMMKQARLKFVNITEIVWGFTGGAGVKTVKYRLK